MIATIYRQADGAVLRVICGPEAAIVEQLDDGVALAEGNWLGWRIDTTTGEPLPLLAFEVDISTNLVTGIPPGTFAEPLGLDPVIVDDGVIEFEVNWPLVRLRLNHPLYEELTVEVPCENQG